MYVLPDTLVKLAEPDPYNRGRPACRRSCRLTKRKRFDQKKEVRKLARERVGTVKATRAIEPKTLRKNPKHKKPLTAESEA